MNDKPSSDNWQLQEGEQPDERWTLRESEQRLADQWTLQDTPEGLDQEWQPVEYVKTSRPAMAWVLPTVVTIALLAVIAYTASQVLPNWLSRGQEPQVVIPPESTQAPEAEDAEASPVVDTP